MAEKRHPLLKSAVAAVPARPDQTCTACCRQRSRGAPAFGGPVFPCHLWARPEADLRGAVLRQVEVGQGGPRPKGRSDGGAASVLQRRPLRQQRPQPASPAAQQRRQCSRAGRAQAVEGYVELCQRSSGSQGHSWPAYRWRNGCCDQGEHRVKVGAS